MNEKKKFVRPENFSALAAKNQEFVLMMEAANWSQAETARKLDLTRGGVNGIVLGRTLPSDTLMRLFKLTLLTENPDALTASEQGHGVPKVPGTNASSRTVEQKPGVGVQHHRTGCHADSPRAVQPMKYPSIEESVGSVVMKEDVNDEFRKLSEIKSADPEAYRALTSMIDTTYRTTRKGKKSKKAT